MTKDPYADPVPDPTPAPPAGAIHELMFLLEWARDRGFRIGPFVRIGGLTLQVSDLRQAKMEGYTADHSAPDIWEEHGWRGHREGQ